MSNYFKKKLKDRLTYCQDWKHSIDMYLANKEITKQADEEFSKTRPFLKFVLNIYFLPYNLLRLVRNPISKDFITSLGWAVESVDKVERVEKVETVEIIEGRE